MTSIQFYVLNLANTEGYTFDPYEGSYENDLGNAFIFLPDDDNESFRFDLYSKRNLTGTATKNNTGCFINSYTFNTVKQLKELLNLASECYEKE